MTDDEITMKFLSQAFGEESLHEDFDALVEPKVSGNVVNINTSESDLLAGTDEYEYVDATASFTDWVTGGGQNRSIDNEILYNNIPENFHLYMTFSIVEQFALKEIEDFDHENLEKFFKCIVLKEFFGLGFKTTATIHNDANIFINSLENPKSMEPNRILSKYIPNADIYELREVVIAVLVLLNEMYDIVNVNNQDKYGDDPLEA